MRASKINYINEYDRRPIKSIYSCVGNTFIPRAGEIVIIKNIKYAVIVIEYDTDNNEINVFIAQ